MGNGMMSTNYQQPVVISSNVGSLIDDFDIVKNGNIIHVRNAPSPAATSCLSIGNKISKLIEK